MSEEVEDVQDEDIEDMPRKKLSGKVLVLFILLPLLLVGAGAGLYFTGFFDSAEEQVVEEEHGEEEAKEAAPKTIAEKDIEEVDPDAPPVFLPLEDILVNLDASGRRSTFLKISMSLELYKQDDVAAIEAVLPRVLDSFQTYLRELRVEDLRGSAGMYRLREELLLRVNAAASPVKVRNVLFREMLVQ